MRITDGAAGRSDTHDVKGIALLIGDGVGSDVIQGCFEPAIGGKVVGGEFDQRGLTGAQEGNVLGLDTGDPVGFASVIRNGLASRR